MASTEAPDYQQLVKNALVEIRRLKATIAELEQNREQDDIAVIGAACCFPGGREDAGDLEAFWQVLADGVDAVREAPEQRLSKAQFYDPNPDAAGKILSIQGGYLNDIDQFAAEFFYISPREADSLDPQQRLLLESHWRALEQAGIPPSSLMGSQTGLFAGICGNDYYHLLASRDYREIDSYMASGTAHSTAVGRVAFYLGTQGPAVAVDTACSSSLVAIHLACQSLRAGECRLALASGVNALLAPEFSINFSRAGMLSPDGRCKTFDDGADGYVRGEGCGVVVLKKLADAQRDGDKVLAVIKGSATNQDGRSSGLTAPNGSAQRQVLKQALQAAGLKAEQVAYVEAHGTGTSLGDPIEIEALQAVYGSRRQTPLTIGSVKSNIGHLEGAAGIAGFIKTVLMLQHQKIPKQLHFQQPNRHVDWQSMNLTVSRQLADWPVEQGQPRIAGVSSFGFGGSNAHVLVAEAPKQAHEAAVCRHRRQLLTLSARTPLELRALAQAYSDYLSANPGLELADFCYTVNVRRDHFAYRLALPCTNMAEAVDGLRKLSEGQAGEERRMALLFTGQGAFNGPLLDVFADLPLFADDFAACEAAFDRQMGFSLRELLFTEQGAARLASTEYAQPALYCFQVALARTWLALGVEADYLLGHSVGEYAAACLAEVFSFEDGLALIKQRGRLMAALSEEGGMLAVLAEADKVGLALQECGSSLCVAGYNGKTNTVVSGAKHELHRFSRYLEQQGMAYAVLNVDRAFHSPLMAPMLREFAASAAGIAYRSPTKNIISTLTGQLIGAEMASAEYWLKQISSPVLFSQALAELVANDVDGMLEVGPQNVLSKLVQREYPDGRIKAISSLDSRQADGGLLDTLAALYRGGLKIDWQAYYQDFKGRHLNVPAYPFSRQRYWFKAAPRTAAPAPALHPFLQNPFETADQPEKQVFSAVLQASHLAFHRDHRYHGKLLLPAAHYLEMAVAALGGLPCRIAQASYPAPLLFDEEQAVSLQLLLTADADGYACAIYARCADDLPWQCHFSARIETLNQAAESMSPIPVFNQGLDVERYYRAMAERGIDFGPAYRLLDSLSAQDQQALGKIKAAPRDSAYFLYPPMLDACFQVAGALLPQDQETYVQTSLALLTYYRPIGQGDIHAHARLTGVEAGQWLFDIDVLAEDGETIARILGLGLKRLPSNRQDGLFYKTQWQAVANPSDEINPEASAAWLAQIARGPEQYWPQPPGIAENQAEVLEAEALNYVLKALQDLAFPYQVGEGFELAQCLRQLGVLPRYSKLLQRCLTVLSQAQYLSLEQEQWRVLKPLVAGPEQSSIAGGIEMQLLRQCGRALAGVLNGNIDFLPLLFPENSNISAATLYSQAEGFTILNRSAVLALDGWLALIPKGRKLRVLEIGAGTGGTTRHLLPLLAGRVDFEYWYTDLSSAFFSSAQAGFADYPPLKYQTLDIAKDPFSQGFAEHGFDLVVAANVVHATADLPQTLSHVRQLLNDQGVLLLLEGLQPRLWVDLIFGLTDGWWAFNDQRCQANYPLLDQNGWQGLLSETGFASTAFITAPLDATERLCRQSVILTQAARTRGRHWLIVDDSLGAADRLADYLNARGDRCTRIDYGQALSQHADASWTVDPFQRRDFERVLQHWFEPEENGQYAVLVCSGLDGVIDETSDSRAVEKTLAIVCAGTLHLLQALGAASIGLQAFNVLTQGAKPVVDGDCPQAAMAALWGMVRVAAKEYPRLQCRLFDLQAGMDLDLPTCQLVCQTDAQAELQNAVRDGRLFVPRLVSCLPGGNQPLTIREQGVYLVTGAFGGMGFKLTQWLIEQGAKHLILLARTAPSAAVKQALDQAAAGSVEIHIQAVDVSDYDALRRAVDVPGRQGLAGIFHSAGVFADCLLQDYDWQVFSSVFPAKVAGAWNLHRLSLELESSPDYFVLFSSSASVLAAGGLANYVAANAFVDALAAYRRRQNLPAHAINWGVWQDTGMAAAVNDIRRQQWQTMGVKPMATDTALAAMRTAIESDDANLAIIDIDFDRYAGNQDHDGYFQALLSRREQGQAQATKAASNGGESIVSLLRQNPDRQREVMLEHVSRLLGSVLGIAGDIDARRGFFELGMDSLTAMELRNRLQREFEPPLDATLTFKYPTLSALADYLLSLLVDTRPKQEEPSAEPVADAKNAINSEEPILSLDEQLADIDRFLEHF
ncbi:type I polyketide synthase [Methylomonas sp. MED-D]|uniref:type I polyketide synthase n=1 Tax=Methylomonas sp. MED-D TaxID=3418768 RepID=UPI003D03C057